MAAFTRSKLGVPVRKSRGLHAPQRRAGRAGLATLVSLAVVATALTGTGVVKAAPVGQGFNLNASDLQFVLKQIKIAEQHAATATPANPCGTLLGSGPNQIPNSTGQGVEIPWGLRTVDGTCNNLVAGQTGFASADKTFPRLVAPIFSAAEPTPAGFGPTGQPTSYTQTKGNVFDSQPRIISNLIVDQTSTNPAAVNAAGASPDVTPSGAFFIPNVAPDVGLSAPYNSWFTLFGQFFDHGLDLTNKSGGTVFMPLKPDDPLYNTAPGSPNFMVLTRSTNQPGPDGIVGDNPATPQDESADDIKNATNQTSPFVDQSQTYTSHPSHQVFLRSYSSNGAGKPVANGKLLTGPGDGMATWATVKAETRAMLGIDLVDADALSVPLLATDPYGRFTPGTNGYPQMVTSTGALVEGNPAANGGLGVRVPADVVKTGHAFLDDIAHNAAPRAGLAADGDSTITPATGTQPTGTYDDEMLNAHFIAGDGRVNENIGLTAVHHVFHSEHNRLTGDIQNVITTEDPASLPEWKLADGTWNGERLFQAARFVTEMQYQHLAFEEFARKVQPKVNLFAGYDRSINSAIAAEFAHAVYRFGHSLLTETVARTSAGGVKMDIPLLDAFLNPPSFTNNGALTPAQAAGSIVRGMTAQRGNELDEFVTEALRNRLLGLPLDLASLNLARGREAGVPPLNAVRRQFLAASQGNPDLAPYANWNDFGLALRNRSSLINFVAAYGKHSSITSATTMASKRTAAGLLVSNGPGAPADSVAFMDGTGAWANVGGITTTGLDVVDLWVGGLAEKQQPFGGLLGSTFNYVFETQMERLQDGDRLYYLSRTAGLNMLVQLEGNSFAELITRNTDAANLPADSFSRLDFHFFLDAQNASGPIVNDTKTPYDETTLLIRMSDNTIRFTGPEHVAFHGTAGADKVWSSEGDDTLRGNDGNDRLEGGAGNDSIISGLGDDVLTDLFGDDVLKAGDGNDALSSGQGFDLNQAGRGNDFVVSGSDPTETFGGPGDDFIFGGDAADIVFGDDGDDWIEGGGQADLLQGDNGAPFQDDPNQPGHDVIDGDGGADDYDSEGGDDIMVSGPGIERNEGMLGFDWVTHESDPQAADSDMSFTGLLPPSLDNLRDRFDAVEGLSGWNYNDILRGNNAVAADMVNHQLNAAGINRITGLSAVVGNPTSFTGGNIILGGAGSDLLEGRGGNDILDGDKYLNVRISVRSATDPNVEIQSAESMSEVRAAVFAGTINPGQLRIVREILSNAAAGDVDTARFSGPAADYDRSFSNGAVIVTHARGTAADGVDTLRNVELLQFADQTFASGGPGAPTIGTATAGPGNGSVTVRWTVPTAPNPLPVTSYEVVVNRVSPTGPATTVTGIPASATSTVVTGLTAGSYNFQVRAVNAAGPGPLSARSNTVTPFVPNATVTPASVAFGNQNVGTTGATQLVTIQNTGTAGSTLNVSSIAVSGAGFARSGGTCGQPANLAQNASCTVGVTFSPASLGAKTGSLVFTHNGTGPTTVPLSGTGVDTIAPTVTARSPAADALAVSRVANITATFSEPVKGVSTTTMTLTPLNLLDQPTGPAIVAVVTPSATTATTTATLNPNSTLAAATRYRVNLTAGIVDLSNNALAPTSWIFTTGAL